jgi:putative MATE family efflux protein
VLLAGLFFVTSYMGSVTADAATREAGRRFFLAVLPGMALQFPLVSMGSALRATGVVKPAMVVSSLSLLINIALAPVLIAGWGTGRPLGVVGAGLATTIAVAIGLVLMGLYYHRQEKYLRVLRSQLAPRFDLWRRIFVIGLPAGGEFGLMFVYFTVIYLCLRDFGAAAQAGFGIGSRVMQAIFLPALALSFAAAPLVGQNFGARSATRVRATFWSTAWMSSILMLALAVVCRWEGEALVRFFTQDAPVIAFAAEFLGFVALSFVASGLIFTCSSIFQGLGNNWPALTASGTRLLTFALPALWMRGQPWFTTQHLWWLSVGTVALQALLSYVLLRRELSLRLPLAVTAAHQPIA